MTTIRYIYESRDWTLTDEASQCSYGEPVLQGDDGRQYRATEMVLPATVIAGIPAPAVTAYDVVQASYRADIASEEWPVARMMIDRFGAQYRRDGNVAS